MAWWNLDGAITSCIAAYQPIGAASYAASLDNLTGNASYDASSAAAPDWDADNGWKFVAANSKYITSNVPVSAIGATGTFIIRFAGYDHTEAGFVYLFGTSISGGTLYVGWRYYDAAGRNAPSLFTSAVVYKDGVDIEGSAVLAVANRTAYKDGNFLVTIAAAGTSTSTNPFEFGRVGTTNYSTMNVLAAAFYNTELSAGQIASLTTAMNALTGAPPADALVAADFTLAAVTFDAPTLSVSANADLTATDFTLAPLSFDTPTLTQRIVTPSCRTFEVEAESRTLEIEAEERGVKFYCNTNELYAPVNYYSGATAKDLTLAAVNFDAPTLEIAGIPQPDAAFSILPFQIYDDGDGTFSVSPTFTLESHSGITVSKTYYVATTGLDTNDGSSGSPFKTMGKAIGMADVDRVYVAAGWYKSWDSAFTEPTRSIQIIGVGDVYITQDWSGNLSWSAVDSHYSATSIPTILAVMDRSSTDANGDWSLLTLKASEAEVEANAASWWFDDPNNKLYIRTADSRTPDSNIAVFFSTAPSVNWTIDNLTIYIENIKFISATAGAYIGSATSAGTGTKALLKDCEYDGVEVGNYGFYAIGCPEMILQNCTAKRTDDDGIRSNPANALVSNVVEWDCTMRNCGKAGDTAVNGSSSHSNGIIVRINGSYHHTYGRPVHDYNLGHSWCLGTHANDNLVAGLANFEMTSGEMWCDQCVSANSDLDYDGAIHKHDCTGDASDGASVDTYDY